MSYILLLHIFFIAVVSGCSVVKFRYMSLEEILYKADGVVYGREVQRVEGIREFSKDGLFEVHCVLKNPSS